MSLTTKKKNKRRKDIEVEVTAKAFEFAVILEKVCELDGGQYVSAGLDELLFSVYLAGRNSVK